MIRWYSIASFKYFNRRRHFVNNGPQNYLIFELSSKIFWIPTGDTKTILPWIFDGLPDESIQPLITPVNYSVHANNTKKLS